MKAQHSIAVSASDVIGAVPGADAFVRSDQMPMLITDPRQTDNPIVFANDAFSKLTGYGRDEILGRNCRFLQGPETDQSDVERMKEAIKRRVPIALDLRNHRKDGTLFWNRIYVAPVFDAGGELTHFFASQFDVTREKDRPSIFARLRTLFGSKPGEQSA